MDTVDFVTERQARAGLEARSDAVLGYGILVRHVGFVDRLLPAEVNPAYGEDNIDHWLASPSFSPPRWDAARIELLQRSGGQFAGPIREPRRFETEEEAVGFIAMLTPRFAPMGYQFTVAVCRLVSRWYILHPKRDSETAPIGSREQLR